MNKSKIKNEKRDRRHARVRSKVSGVEARPRFSVFRSNRGLFVQLINDEIGKTLVSAASSEIKKKGTKVDLAKELGLLVAKKATEAKISQVVFDKGSYKYHGQIKALAEGAREGGLIF